MKVFGTARSTVTMVVLALALSALTACSHSVNAFDLTETKPSAVSCSDIHDVSNEIAKIKADHPGKSRDNALNAWNIEPKDVDAINRALDKRADDCKANPSASPSALAQAINGTGTPPTGPCLATFKQKFDPNKKGNFSSAGVKNTDDVIAHMGHDARYLAFVGNLVRPDDIKADPSSLLVPGNKCLSQEGQVAWGMVKGTLTAKDVKINNDAQAPANGYNTGIVNGHGVVDPHQGVGGNRTSIEYTFPKGNKLDIMKRCGNPVLNGQGNLPKGPTDHQRPSTPSTTPPVGHPTSPSPSLEAKHPTQAPGNGGAGDGGSSKYGGTGTDRQAADPNAGAPSAGTPPTRYTPPPVPKPAGPPAGSTPTHNTPPPQEPGTGDDNSGDPGPP